jgi:hypothetical protein
VRGISCRRIPSRGRFPSTNKERIMRRMARKMVCLLVLVFLAGGMWSVVVAQEASDLSGTVTVTATSVAAGIGWSWGSGTLTLLDGSEHQFKVSGLDVVAVGINRPRA